ncbi:hypothetical protein FE257_007430 [Aspergillus nanangensis]|uniref:Zn(2)-C6 fungal-type domain-containing protein n=1 Tax=Aspergillus nanangensis TaxID=2582783 RepID=A0AAD4CMN1_ASPNN|nr:hypothetical protein FE257_007430 [Aspergillus nanangensis]
MQSRLKSRKACALCHERKIKCDGATPSCRNCLRVQAVCRPHERRRRITGRFSSDAEGNSSSETLQRITWLEQEIHRVFGVDVRQVRTGIPLDSLTHNNDNSQHESEDVPGGVSNVTPSQTPRYHPPSAPQHEDHPDRLHEVDPDISLLALNATGEVRYLGASSGSFFAKYIANVAHSLASSTAELSYNPEAHAAHIPCNTDRHMPVFTPANWRTPETFPFLVRCYARWVHSIYPLFPADHLTMLNSISSSSHLPQDNTDTTVIFYLVISIGAIHAEQTHLLNELHGDTGIHAYQNASTQGLSAEALYRKAINVLETGIQSLAPRISLVQILNLVSVYASHRPSDNKQWHIGGIAMRVSQRDLYVNIWKLSEDELELRRRVFWTTYAIEITLAFNLGRPASISFEDADAPFPKGTQDMIMPIHHIRHRQIQEQMLSQVYRGRKTSNFTTADANQSVLDGLQNQLDQWHQELHELHTRSTSPYPVEYWDRFYYSTSAALSRPTPLVPRPGPGSHERCFLSSGRVIEIHDQLIRQFRLPNSWMLLQGLTLSAVSMIVTARTHALVLSRKIGFENLLDSITKWVRKLCVVMAVMRERWPAFATNHLEDLLDKISRDTVRHIISMMASDRSIEMSSAGRVGSDAIQPASSLVAGPSGVSMDHMQYTMMNSPGSLVGDATLSTAHSEMDSGLLGFDPDAIWGSFDNLFETNALQNFFSLVSGQEYI